MKKFIFNSGELVNYFIETDTIQSVFFLVLKNNLDSKLGVLYTIQEEGNQDIFIGSTIVALRNLGLSYTDSGEEIIQELDGVH